MPIPIAKPFAQGRGRTSARCGPLVRGLTVLAIAASMPVPAREYRVTAYSNMTFSPASIVIAQGDSVRFENGGGLHNVHADDDRFVCAVDCTTHTTPSSAAWQSVVRFDVPGAIGYYCDEHGGRNGGMRGSITVVEAIFIDGFDLAVAGSPAR